MSLVGVVNKSKSLLDKFIDAQTASKSACSSRLMESKRVLDGLLKDVASLNSQVMSREQIVETETENLAISKMSLEAVKTEYYKSMRHCKQQRKEAIEDYKKYAQELNELNQIAMPSERYNHAVFVRSNDTHTKVFQGERLQTRESLLQVSFDKKMCLAFVKFAKRHSDVLGDTPPKEGGKACDEQREELQKAFTKAYAVASQLRQDARERALDKTCYQSAHAKLSAELVPLVSQRDTCVEKINAASQAIAALDPVLNLVKTKAEKLRVHISEKLSPECKDAAQASKLLVQVRELILSLEECPGRNDFVLNIPSKDEIAQISKELEEEANDEENAVDEKVEASEKAVEKDIATEEPASVGNEVVTVTTTEVAGTTTTTTTTAEEEEEEPDS